MYVIMTEICPIYTYKNVYYDQKCIDFAWGIVFNATMETGWISGSEPKI